MSERRTTYSQPHEWECPGCGKISEIGDSWEFRRGNTVQCVHCQQDSEIYNQAIDYEVYWATWLKQEEPAHE